MSRGMASGGEAQGSHGEQAGERGREQEAERPSVALGSGGKPLDQRLDRRLGREAVAAVEELDQCRFVKRQIPGVRAQEIASVGSGRQGLAGGVLLERLQVLLADPRVLGQLVPG